MIIILYLYLFGLCKKDGNNDYCILCIYWLVELPTFIWTIRLFLFLIRFYFWGVFVLDFLLKFYHRADDQNDIILVGPTLPLVKTHVAPPDVKISAGLFFVRDIWGAAAACALTKG